MFGMIYSVPQSHAIVIERFGKYSRTQLGGIRFKLPIIESIKTVEYWGDEANKGSYYIELAEQRTDTQPRQCHTKDNVSINVNASIYWRILEPHKAIYEVDNIIDSLPDSALNALRANVGTLTLDQTLSERQKLNDLIFTQLEQITKSWGIQLIRVEIQEITTNDDTADAMRQEMTAERQKRALILEAEGKKQSEITTAEGIAESIRIKAKAEAEALKIKAAAEKEYLTQIIEKIGKENAGKVLISEKYILGMESISKNPSDKVFVPNNFSPLFNFDLGDKK